MQWSKAAFFGFIEFSDDISSTKIDIPMNEQTSKSIVCHCRSAHVFQTSHSRNIPFTGHGPYRYCEQNPKTSMQIRIIVRVCKFNCFFQRLIIILFLKPCTENFPFYHFRDKSYRIWQIIFIPDVYIFYMFCKYVLNATSRGGSRDSVDGGWGVQLWSNIFND